MLIAAFKLGQALLFIAVGVGALKLVGKDLGDELLTLARHLRFGPESRFVDFVLDRASFVTDRMLRRIGVALFAYAALGMAEGIGLYLEKVWAEYFTIILTAAALPWEIFELIRDFSWFKVALMFLNVLVLLYLLWLVRRMRLRQSREALHPVA